MNKIIMERFGARIKELGFKKKRVDAYVRATEHGSCGVFIFVSKRYGAWQVTINPFVRIDALESLLIEFHLLLWGRKLKRSFSATANIGIVKARYRQSWDIYSESEIDTELDEMIEMFRMYGLPYVEEFSEPMKLYCGFLDPKRDIRLEAQRGRAWQKALALTLVMNRYDLFEKTAHDGFSLLPRIPQNFLDEFTQLVDWLRPQFPPRSSE